MNESYKQRTEPAGPMRSRKLNAPSDNKSFQNPRASIPIDNLKPKSIPENKVWARETKISTIESKPIQAKKLVQKNKELNHQAQIVAKPELKCLMQKKPVGIKKLAVQKKNLLKATKTNSIQLSEEIVPAPKIKKIAKVTNVQIEKTKPQEKTPALQKTKPQNDISNIKNKAQNNVTNNPKISAKTNIAPVQNTKPQQNTSKPQKEDSEIALKTNPTQEKTVQDTENEDKATPVITYVVKETKEQSKIEESSINKIELEPLLALAVEEELQDIMIQVWQELPDDPSETDRIAVDKLRNEAGDDLRRVLGLNITKRLLNVYNNLFVKMQFTCRPQMGCLTNFLKEYHIKNFKRIDKNSNTFAAQMENIEDFDKLCTVKEIKCGEAKVSITPCYKFTQCPENLKTIYDDSYFYETTNPEHPKTPESKNKNNIQKAEVIVSNENIQPSTKVEHIDSKSSDNDRTEIAETVSNDGKSTEKDIKNINTNETKIQKSSNLVSNDPIESKPDSTKNENDEQNDSSKLKTGHIKSREIKITDSNKNEKQIHKVINNYVIKDDLENDDDLESGVPEYLMEGDEELGDEDILALMSEGVVLDECSGSEDEK